MNNQTDQLDQADEEILTPTVSDEALEAIAGLHQPAYSKGQTDWPFHNIICC